MSDFIYEAKLPGVEQVVDLLETYADERLSPRSPVLARMRRHVMAEAAARAAAEESDRLAALAAHRQPWWKTVHLRIPRGVAAAGMAAVMVFGTSAAVLAASPGSLLYGARVTLEQVFLPAQPEDRVAAHEELLTERLAEAQAAADRGDAEAVRAALAAYQAEIDAAVADVGYDPELLAFLETALTKHTALLQTLAAKLPEQAAIQQAIQASQKAADKLHDTGKPPFAGEPGAHATPPTSNSGENSGENNAGSGGGDNRVDGDDQGEDRNQP